MIGYKFKDKSLEKTALTHPSAAKNNRKESYERLEFLGDKLIGMIVAARLWEVYPDASESDLSLMHANLVNTKTMASAAKMIGLDKLLIFDKGEEQKEGRKNPNILEDAMEAYAAAIFLDSDITILASFINELWQSFVADVSMIQERDSKSMLQEKLQKMGLAIPNYVVDETKGSAHNPTFTISLEVKDIGKVSAHGKTKKEAQQNVAKLMLEKIRHISVE